MVAPTCFGITLLSSESVPSAFWEMLNWGAVDRILWMDLLCLVTCTTSVNTMFIPSEWLLDGSHMSGNVTNYTIKAYYKLMMFSVLFTRIYQPTKSTLHSCRFVPTNVIYCIGRNRVYIFTPNFQVNYVHFY
jgi:hypothetical protein